MPRQTNTEKQKRTRTLTTTLSLAFLGLSVVTALVANGFGMYSDLQSQRETVAAKQQLVAQDAASTVAGFIQEHFNTLEAAVKFSDSATASQEEQKRILEKLLGIQPSFRHLVLFDAQDREVTKVSRLQLAALAELASQIESDVFTQVEQDGRYVSAAYVDPATSEPQVLIAIQVTNAFGDVLGTLVAEVNLKFMWDMVDRLEVGESGLAYVVDRQGDLIAFGDVSRVLRGENVGHLSTVRAFINHATLAGEAGTSISSGIKGNTVVGTYVSLGVPDWAVVIEMPVQEAYREMISATAVSLGVLLGVAVIAGLVGIYVARRMAVPILNLARTAEQIAAGNTKVEATLAGPAEVVSLARVFNSMTAQLRDLIGDLERRNERLHTTVERYDGHMAKLAEETWHPDSISTGTSKRQTTHWSGWVAA
jgi:methyl-accepting chemotaxis protein